VRLALLSDVHGNSIALDAVLADVAAAGGVDGYWVLGDLVALGPDPNGVLERLDGLPGVDLLRGNTDRYVVTGERPAPSRTDDPAELVEIAATFAWTQGALTASGRLDDLAELPLELRRTLPDGTRLLAVHASPGRDDGAGVGAHVDLAAIAAASAADLVVCGHTHVAFDRTVDGVRLVNLGSVSNPPPEDRRAAYAVLDANEVGYELEPRRVEYDHEAVVEQTLRLRHPGADFIAAAQRGVHPAHVRLTPWRAN
jgi:predicted phosphodiesterase